MVALKTKAHEVSDGLQIYKNWPSCAGDQFNQTKSAESNIEMNWWGQPEPAKSSLSNGPKPAGFQIFAGLKLRSEAD